MLTHVHYSPLTTHHSLIKVIELHFQIFYHTTVGAKHGDAYPQQYEEGKKYKQFAIIPEICEIRQKVFE